MCIRDSARAAHRARADVALERAPLVPWPAVVPPDAGTRGTDAAPVHDSAAGGKAVRGFLGVVSARTSVDWALRAGREPVRVRDVDVRLVLLDGEPPFAPRALSAPLALGETRVPLGSALLVPCEALAAREGVAGALVADPFSSASSCVLHEAAVMGLDVGTGASGPELTLAYGAAGERARVLGLGEADVAALFAHGVWL